MVREGQEVRIRSTGEIASVLEFDPNTGICQVEKTISFSGDDSLDVGEFLVTELVELRDASTEERKAIAAQFDLVVFSGSLRIDMHKSPTLIIRKVEGGLSLRVYSMFGDIDEERLICGEDADRFISGFGRMKSYRWVEPFMPACGVLDGYGWDLTVYSGSLRYFCRGSNAQPYELVDFLNTIPGYDLPKVWSDGPYMDVPDCDFDRIWKRK